MCVRMVSDNHSLRPSARRLRRRQGNWRGEPRVGVCGLHLEVPLPNFVDRRVDEKFQYERGKDRITMLNEERRKDVGRVGDLHPCGNVGLIATRTVIEQYGWKCAGTSWFPKVCFEMQRSERGRAFSLAGLPYAACSALACRSRRSNSRYFPNASSISNFACSKVPA